LTDSSSAGGILSAMVRSRPATPGKEEPEGQRALAELMRLMYRQGADLTMRTRLTDEQIEAGLGAVAVGRFVGYKPLEEAAYIMFELLVSREGGGRNEAAHMARAVYEASKEQGAANEKVGSALD